MGIIMIYRHIKKIQAQLLRGEKVFVRRESILLSFFKSNRMGGRNTPQQFAVAAIFMNIRCTFYGNQFTHELGNRVRVNLNELMALAP